MRIPVLLLLSCLSAGTPFASADMYSSAEIAVDR